MALSYTKSVAKRTVDGAPDNRPLRLALTKREIFSMNREIFSMNREIFSMNRPLRSLTASVTLCAALMANAHAHSHITPAYALTPISIPGADYVAGEAINGTGQVAVGTFFENARGYLWQQGVATELEELPGGNGTYANAISDRGTIAGFASNMAGLRRAIAWREHDAIVDLGTLGGDRSEARGINGAGTIIGNSRNAANERRAFQWTAADGMVELPISLGGTAASANAINAAGQVAGSATTAEGRSHAVVFDPHTSMSLDLGTLGGAESFANGINASGAVVGLAETADDFRPFYWSSATGMVDVFTGGDLGTPFGAAYDINAQGVVVGYGEINDDFDSHAFAWSLTDGLIDLNARLQDGEGWTLFGASGINDAGQIVGWGALNGVPTGFVLTPVPIPAATWLFGSALASLAWRRRSHQVSRLGA
jgi:probable HAF family extracellular repeat protein